MFAVSGLGHRVGSVGRPYWGVSVKILDPDPKEGGVGEVAATGRNIFMGYQKQVPKKELSGFFLILS